MDKYRSQAQEIQDDRDLYLDFEHLHLDINEDYLLDDLESMYMVDTQSSLHRE